MNSHIITEFRKEEQRGLTVLPSIRTWYMLKYSAADSTVEYKRSLEQMTLKTVMKQSVSQKN